MARLAAPLLAASAAAQRPSFLKAPWRPSAPGGCRGEACCAEQCAASGHAARACADACLRRTDGDSVEAIHAACYRARAAPPAPAAAGQPELGKETCKPDLPAAGNVSSTPGSSLDACLAGALLGAAAPAPLPGAGAAPQEMTPSSFFWDMSGAGPGQTGRGFSWYTRIFALFQEGHALPLQMGMGGTWLATKGLHYDVCPCKDDPCCDNGECDCCAHLFQSFEGGPGYWGNELPTTVSKWRVGDSVGCYSAYTGSPMFQFGDYGGHDCDKMGLAQVSNQLVMAPDGVTFDVEGMVGVSYVHTPLGKVNESDGRNFWTIVLDTENFAGPVAYFMPEFWAMRRPGDEARTQHLGDFGNCPEMSMGAGGAFEWNTLHTWKASNGDYKLPRMTIPYKDGRTVLMMNHKSWEDADLSEPLEAALKSGKFDVSALMAGGEHRKCGKGQSDATFKVEGDLTFSVGTLRTTVEGGECVWSVRLHNDSCAADGDCAFPRYVSAYDAGLLPIPESKAPRELVAQEFRTKTGNNKYDQLSKRDSRKCLSSPGPADANLYCVQTLKGGESSTWIGYKWYKFVDQPGLQQARLTETEQEFMQGRIEALHKMAGRTSRWMKAGRAVDEGLAITDKATLVTPPKGLEHGYVPIALYEGFAKPDGCHAAPDHPVPPSPPRPTPPPGRTPRPTPYPPEPAPRPVHTPPPTVPPTQCEAKCIAAGHCCRGTTSSYNHPSCAMGCFIAAHSKSAAACKSTCKGADAKCSWSFAGTDFNNCGDCNMDPAGTKRCNAADGVGECNAGCGYASYA